MKWSQNFVNVAVSAVANNSFDSFRKHGMCRRAGADRAMARQNSTKAATEYLSSLYVVMSTVHRRTFAIVACAREKACPGSSTPDLHWACRKTGETQRRPDPRY